MAKRVAILTGGGDCPGLNAVIRACTWKLIMSYGFEVVGVKRGWQGLLVNDFMPLDINSVSGILPRGGTILRTSRTNPFKEEGAVDLLVDNIRQQEIWAVIAVGGDDTLRVAQKLQENYQVNVVGVPKTIDNDLAGTDYTFGFDTAVQIATEAIDRIHSTAESHDRVMVVEVMGRHTGWIAVAAGIAGGADVIMIPEVEMTIEEACEIIKKRHARGKDFSIVVVSEGVKLKYEQEEVGLVVQSEEVDAFGHVRLGGVGNVLGKAIEKITGFETRVTVLGHVQRGGTPTSRDRMLATRFGIKAADMVRNEDFGHMVALRGDQIQSVPLAEAVAQTKQVPNEYWDIARTFFG